MKTAIERLEEWTSKNPRHRFWSVTCYSSATWNLTLFTGCDTEAATFKGNGNTFEEALDRAFEAEARHVVQTPAIGPVALEPMETTWAIASCL